MTPDPWWDDLLDSAVDCSWQAVVIAVGIILVVEIVFK